jgi:hypothetical protein
MANYKNNYLYIVLYFFIVIVTIVGIYYLLYMIEYDEFTNQNSKKSCKEVGKLTNFSDQSISSLTQQECTKPRILGNTKTSCKDLLLTQSLRLRSTLYNDSPICNSAE